MTMEEMYRDMAEELIAQIGKAFERQRQENCYAPLHVSLERVSDGGNTFEVELWFKPCALAEAQPSRN